MNRNPCSCRDALILLLEDNKGESGPLATHLRKWYGLRMKLFADPIRALAWARTNTFGAALVDLALGGEMNGYEFVLRAIDEFGMRPLQFVFMSCKEGLFRRPTAFSNCKLFPKVDERWRVETLTQISEALKEALGESYARTVDSDTK